MEACGGPGTTAIAPVSGSASLAWRPSATADAPVVDLEDAVGVRRHPRVVGRDDRRDAALVHEGGDQRHHRLGVGAVELAGRLVGDEQAGVVREGARDAEALLLAARQLVRALVGVRRRARRSSSSSATRASRSLGRDARGCASAARRSRPPTAPAAARRSGRCSRARAAACRSARPRSRRSPRGRRARPGPRSGCRARRAG